MVREKKLRKSCFWFGTYQKQLDLLDCHEMVIYIYYKDSNKAKFKNELKSKLLNKHDTYVKIKFSEIIMHQKNISSRISTSRNDSSG